MRTTLTILAAALLAASCGGSDDAPPALDDGPDAASTPTADPTSDPASGGAADNPMATVDGAGRPPADAGEPDGGATSTGDGAEPAGTTVPAGSADAAEPGSEPSASSTLRTPTYRGTLPFASVRAVDLDPFLAEEGLRDVNTRFSLARDGDGVRLDVTDELNRIVAVATVDAATGTPSWVATDLSPDTVVLFDANDAPVAVAGLGCRPATYEKRFDGDVVDLGDLVPAGRCLSAGPRASADGNVVVFRTYDPADGTPYLASDTHLHAYTLDTANLVELIDVVLDENGTALSPRPFGPGADLSDDGAHYFAPTLWEGTGADGAAVRTAGAVLWDTAAGTWQLRGARADLRGCTPTERVSCAPPYAYAMSRDGDVQYAEVPTDRPNDAEGAYFRPFTTVVERALTDAPAPETLPGLENATGFVTNDDGSLLLVDALYASDAMPAGFTLYRPGTGEHVSLNRALNACPDADEAGAAVPAEDCRFTSVPRSIMNDPATFTADGTSLVIRSVDRVDENFDQEVGAVLIDVDTGAAYSMPRNFSSDPAAISADASVFLGTGDAPGHDLLIGRR